jgi:argininosuccinate lyase
MAAQLEPGLLATDLADYLVRRGVPFRQAHELVGRAVKLAEEKDLPLTKLSLADLQTLSDSFGDDVEAVFDVETSLSTRVAPGGTAPEALRQQLATAEELLASSIRLLH